MPTRIIITLQRLTVWATLCRQVGQGQTHQDSMVRCRYCEVDANVDDDK